tara:strand:- start:873 stop:1094 length:222 start_codon:yes stop_codon:yes gene_type:complete
MKTPDNVKKDYEQWFTDTFVELCEYDDGVEVLQHCMNFAIANLSSWHLKELQSLSDMQSIIDKTLPNQNNASD